MKIDHPKIQEQSMTMETIQVLQSKVEYRDQLIEHISLENQEAIKASFENVIFRNVIISDSSLEQFEFTDVVFENCDFSNVNFSGMTGTKLKDLDLSNCQFDSLALNMEDLNGCIISPYQAATFVGLMGIVIKS